MSWKSLEQFFTLDTRYGDTFTLFWILAILFFVLWDTVSTWYARELFPVEESIPFSKYILDNYGYLALAVIKLTVVMGLWGFVHLVPDSLYTIKGFAPISADRVKDIYIPIIITLFGLYATVHNFLLVR